MTTSLLEALNTDRTVADKARFVDYFSGDSLKSWWTETDIQGAGSIAMNDVIDGGVKATSGSSNTDRTVWDFNDKRQFSATASKVTAHHRRDTSQGILYYGLGSTGVDPISTNTSIHRVSAHVGGGSSAQVNIGTCNGSSFSATASIINGGDLTWIYSQIENTSTNSQLTVFDELRVTKTTHLPTQQLQCFFGIETGTASAQSGSIRYYEAYNT